MALFIDLIHTYFIHAICLDPHFVTLFCSVSFTLLGRMSFLFWCFYTSFSLAGSVGVGVKRDRIPKGDSLSPSQGEAIKPKPPNDECRLLPSSSGWSLRAVVGLSHRHNHFWAGVPHWEPTRLSWKGSDNETLCGQQRHLPLLLVTLKVFMWNSPTSNTVCRIRVWTVMPLTGKLQTRSWWKSSIFQRIGFASAHSVAI